MKSIFKFPNPINEVSSRLVASGVAFLGFICLVFAQPWLMVVLAGGFLLRMTFGPRIDPLALFVTRILTPKLPIAEHLTAGPPKRFAQGIGAFVAVTASLFAFPADMVGWAYVLIAVLVVLASLEAAIGFCMGCKMFSFLMRLGVIPASVCKECNDLNFNS